MNSSDLSEESRQRFEPRKRYVEETFIPQLFSIGIEASTFSAITPKSVGVGLNETTVSYAGKEYRRGRNREGVLCSPVQAVLTLGHLQLWKESVSENTPILILEDDACIPTKNEETIWKTISHFLSVVPTKDTRGILYLQSTCPWRLNKQLKEYDPWAVLAPRLFSSDLLFRLAPTWSDTSGTIAYLVTPSSANMLINHVEQHPIWTIDGMLDDAKTLGEVHYYIPLDYSNQFTIHPSF
jgi:GR25 family glycosyltransferase involved in LPS biosynthesis